MIYVSVEIMFNPIATIFKQTNFEWENILEVQIFLVIRSKYVFLNYRE